MHLKGWVRKTWRNDNFCRWFANLVGDLDKDRRCNFCKVLESLYIHWQNSSLALYWVSKRDKIISQMSKRRMVTGTRLKSLLQTFSFTLSLSQTHSCTLVTISLAFYSILYVKFCADVNCITSSTPSHSNLAPMLVIRPCCYLIESCTHLDND